jgi:protein SCO1/2
VSLKASQRRPGRALVHAVVAAALSAAAAGPARAQTRAQLERELAAIGVEERLGAVVPGDVVLTGDDGRAFALRERAGRPLLVSFNYTSCAKLCGLQLAGLARALHEARWDGRDFGVLTVSIDPAETLPQVRRYKDAFVHQAGGGDAVAHAWTFATGTKAAIDALAASVGFRYRYDPASGQFAHQATLVVLTGDGRVSGYLHGVSYAPDALQAALARARAGRVASAEEQRGLGGFLLACVGFSPDDPTPLALKIMRAGGGAAALSLLSFLGVHAVRGARRRRSPEIPTP